MKNFKDSDAKLESQSDDFTCQCDIGTEHYEKLLNDEKDKFVILQDEASENVKIIEKLKLDMEEIRHHLSSEINNLKLQLNTVQVCNTCIPFGVLFID